MGNSKIRECTSVAITGIEKEDHWCFGVFKTVFDFSCQIVLRSQYRWKGLSFEGYLVQNSTKVFLVFPKMDIFVNVINFFIISVFLNIFE